MSHQPLAAILGRLRSRLFAVDGLTGLLWGFVAALLCVAAGVWLDLMLELPPLAANRLPPVVGRHCGRPADLCHETRLSPRNVFRLGHVVAGANGQIVTEVELSQATAAAAHSSNAELTQGLAQLAIRQATDLAGTVPGPQVVPFRGVRRSGSTLAAAVAVGLAVTLLLPRMAATEWRRFTDPFGDHPPLSNLLFDVQPGNAQVIYGAGLEIHVAVQGPAIEGVELVMVPLGETSTTAGTAPENESSAHEVRATGE